MAINHLKRASKTPETESGNARAVAEAMLADVARRGEDAVRDYALKLDGWSGPIVLDAAAIAARIQGIPETVRRDIDYATEQVRRCALAQRASVREFATEIAPGLVAG